MAKSSSGGTVVSLVPGKCYSLLYPEHPYYGIPSRLRAWFVSVDSVIDLQENPIPQAEFDRNPLLLRSTQLVNCRDITTGATVEFHGDYIQHAHEVPMRDSIEKFHDEGSLVNSR